MVFIKNYGRKSITMKENIIEIYLNDRNDYKNVFNNNKLSYELSNYILEESKSLSTKQKIKFIVSSSFDMDDKDKNEFVDMLRENFGTDVSEIINIKRKENISNFISLLIGIVLLIIYCIDFKTVFLSELILIIGWGFLWESIYNFFFKGIKTRLMITRRKQIISGKIEFKKGS